MRDAWKAAEGCLSLDEIGALVHQKATNGQRTEYITHLAACPTCAAEMRLLQEFEGATARPNEYADVSAIVTHLERNSAKIFGRLPWWKRLASSFNFAQASVALSAVAIVMTAGLYLRGPQEPVLDGTAGGGSVYRAGSIQRLAPVGDVAQAPESLAWEAVSGAASYEVTILEVDRTVMWKSASSLASVVLPPDVRSRLVPAKTVSWQVIARNAAGATISESAPALLRVKP